MNPVAILTGGLFVPLVEGDGVTVVQELVHTAELVGVLLAEDPLVGTLLPAVGVTLDGGGGVDDFSILTFATPTTLLEIGEALATPSFTSSQNATPAALVLTNSDTAEAKSVVLTPTAFSSDDSFQKTTPNASVTFTLTGNDGVAVDIATTTARWRARHFVGVTTNPGPYTEADILALEQLTSELSSNRLFDLDFTSLSGHYLVHAYDESFAFDALKYIANDFLPAGMTEVQSGVSGIAMSRPGGTYTVHVARSDFAQTAATLGLERIA